jgi:hypothetical protein
MYCAVAAASARTNPAVRQHLDERLGQLARDREQQRTRTAHSRGFWRSRDHPSSSASALDILCPGCPARQPGGPPPACGIKVAQVWGGFQALLILDWVATCMDTDGPCTMLQDLDYGACVHSAPRSTAAWMLNATSIFEWCCTQKHCCHGPETLSHTDVHKVKQQPCCDPFCIDTDQDAAENFM